MWQSAEHSPGCWRTGETCWQCQTCNSFTESPGSHLWMWTHLVSVKLLVGVQRGTTGMWSAQSSTVRRLIHDKTNVWNTGLIQVQSENQVGWSRSRDRRFTETQMDISPRVKEKKFNVTWSHLLVFVTQLFKVSVSAVDVFFPSIKPVLTSIKFHLHSKRIIYIQNSSVLKTRRMKELKPPFRRESCWKLWICFPGQKSDGLRSWLELSAVCHCWFELV